MYTLDLARAHIRELHREAADSRRGQVAPQRRGRSTRRDR